MFRDKYSFISRYNSELIRHFGKPADQCGNLEKYEALADLLRKYAAEVRTDTEQRFLSSGRKEVYYFSMEFLIGRLLKNYLINFGIDQIVSDGLRELGCDLDELCECENDPGLGNGGLGRLAACFLDSMAFLGIDATGMGIRYRFGLFRQRIIGGWQTEEPDTWLEFGYPWETRKSEETVTIKFGGTVERTEENGRQSFRHRDYTCVNAVPYDVPVVSYGGNTVNTLRLWRAQPFRETLDLAAFNRGDYSTAVSCRNEAEAISCILYPDDSSTSGKELRLKQEYFFVSAGLSSVLRKYKRQYGTDQWKKLPERVSIHTNDTHPALCVPELMRLLIDEELLSWEEAWGIVTRTISYTNHTVMPEALEKWPVALYSRLLPRIYMITEEIDRRYRAGFDRTRSGWETLLEATAILKGGQVHMANLSVIGSHSVNGVAALHTEILKADTLKDFYALTPEKFNNKTNGVTHRRFLLEANPGLGRLITDSIGDGWIKKPEELQGLLQFREDSAFLEKLAAVKRESKHRLANYIARSNNIPVDPDSIFDIQVKRIHAYKRQLLNTFKIMDLYNRLKADPSLKIPPHTFIMAGKAAQSYVFAKETVKLFCSVADIVNADPAMQGRIKVVFLENFNVSLAQLIYPAADLSEQISTAGKEASGTGNMKFMMNGAVTLGTLDGANVEIRNLVGSDNILIFGMKAEEVMVHERRGDYSAAAVSAADPRLSLITGQLTNGFFSQAGYSFSGIYDALLKYNDQYFVLQDFDAYVKAWMHAGELYADKSRWGAMSIANTAMSGHFSSDRTIAEYARDIWHI